MTNIIIINRGRRWERKREAEYLTIVLTIICVGGGGGWWTFVYYHKVLIPRRFVPYYFHHIICCRTISIVEAPAGAVFEPEVIFIRIASGYKNLILK